MNERVKSTLKITCILYPFGVGAMAVNVFFLSLLGSWLGGSVLSTKWSIFLGCLIAIPATWYFAKHIRNLMDKGEEASS